MYNQFNTKTLLDKYIPQQGHTPYIARQNYIDLQKIKEFIINTGVEVLYPDCYDFKYPIFIPGHTDVFYRLKPHHKDPKIRLIEEELFTLHDLYHQLFPLPINTKSIYSWEYSLQQVIGEIIVFFITEYFTPLNLFHNNTSLIDNEDYLFFMNYIRHERGYFSLLEKLMIKFNYNLKDCVTYIVYSEESYDEDVRKLKKMFEQDSINSLNNFELLTQIDIEKTNDFKYLDFETHFNLINLLFNDRIKPYTNKKLNILIENWI